MIHISRDSCFPKQIRIQKTGKNFRRKFKIFLHQLPSPNLWIFLNNSGKKSKDFSNIRSDGKNIRFLDIGASGLKNIIPRKRGYFSVFQRRYLANKL